MKLAFLNTLIICLPLASTAMAQEKVTVPLSSPNQPVTLKVHSISGSITVTAGSGNQVVVSTSAGAEPDSTPTPPVPPAPPGMHRIDPPRRGFNVEEDHNVVTITPDIRGRGSLTIEVPVNTSVELKSVNAGHLDVTGINGEIDVENTNGEITLKNVSGAITAHTLNGKITASIDKVAADKPMSFTSMNGRVDVTLPADTKARLRLKTTHGEVYSDFDVKMEVNTSKPVVEDGRAQGGKYRIRTDRGVYGSINGGGPEYLFQTMNGTILIHKK